MRVGIREEPFPLVRVERLGLFRRQPIPNPAASTKSTPSQLQTPPICRFATTHGLISAIWGFCVTLYPDCTNGQAV